MVPIVVPVGMLMLKHFVRVLVTMSFRQVQYHSRQHQYPVSYPCCHYFHFPLRPTNIIYQSSP